MLHFIITLQHQNRPGDITYSTRAGTFTPEPGDTRSSVFQKILDWAAKENGAGPGTVLFFALDLNELAPAGVPAAAAS